MTKLTADERDNMPAKEFAFPKQRKAPIEDAAHVRAAIARFNQVKDVTDEERDQAWERIKRAAKKHDVAIEEAGWRDIGR
jgi:ElaB/YqjD/DUF883 family membrane-anchored ribosome-binding protein